MENNIKAIRTKLGLSQKEVANALNITQAAVSSWEQGRWYPDISSLIKLADFYGVSTDTLLGRSNDIDLSNSEPPRIKTSLIPIVSRVSVRFDPFDRANFVGELEVGEALIKMYPRIYAIEVNNDAMYPEIQIGDYAIIAPGTPVKDGDMGMICIKNDDGFIKRVHYSDDGIELISINDIYGTIRYTKDQVKNIPVYILGKLIGVNRFYG